MIEFLLEGKMITCTPVRQCAVPGILEDIDNKVVGWSMRPTLDYYKS